MKSQLSTAGWALPSGGRTNGSDFAVPSALVVDDELPIALLVAEALRDEGFATSIARDGIEALEAMQADLPDVMVLDLRMPRLDGEHLMAEMRARNIKVPTIVISAHRDAREVAHAAGAAGYLTKPFDLEQLLNLVQAAV